MTFDIRYKLKYDSNRNYIQIYNSPITFKQGNQQSNVLEVQMYQGASAIDLTDESIEFRFVKGDATVVYQDELAGVVKVDALNGVVQCTLLANTVAVVGAVTCEIYRTINGKSIACPQFTFYVEESLDSSGVLSTDYISNVEESLLLTTQNRIDAQQSAVDAEASAVNAGVSEVNAGVSEVNAGLSAVDAQESAVSAGLSAGVATGNENVTTQVMQDFLAMLGSDVATLTGGKLTASQIPAISINSTTVITDVADITAVTAQEGDTVLIVPVDVVTDSYILAGSDSTVLSNWKKLGVAYVAEAGHAVNSDVATDATMINGHRIVTMTQAQYDVAVKDADTIYLVVG